MTLPILLLRAFLVYSALLGQTEHGSFTGETQRLPSHFADITCAGAWNSRGMGRLALKRWCTDGELEPIGSVTKIAGDWDMSGYDIAPETGHCDPS